MAKPELENGHTRIANELIDNLVRLHLSPNQWQVLFCVIRKTYGYHKKVDYIANSQIQQMTGLGKTVVSRALKYLEENNLIIRKKKVIGIQKDWELWERLKPIAEIGIPSSSYKLRIKRQDGYFAIWGETVEDEYKSMATKQGYILEHRLIMARKLGRCLEPWEIVHHIDGDSSNNNEDNLELLPGQTEHLPSMAAQKRIKELERELAELRTNVDDKLAEKSVKLSKQITKVSSPVVAQKKKDTITKDKYGEFGNVLLTKEEYSKLGERYGNRLPGMIEELSAGIESKGYKYKSHYATIINWANRDQKGGTSGAYKRRNTQPPSRQGYTRPEQYQGRSGRG